MVTSADPVVDADTTAIAEADLPWSELAGARVLVTGASGMIGSYACLALLAASERHGLGLHVDALARSADRAQAALGPAVDRADMDVVIGDVTALPDLEADVIVHAASAAQPGSHVADPVGTFRANVTGTLDLLELARKHPAQFRGMVFTSSAEVYGAQPETTDLIGESSYGGFDHLAPRASYAEGKRAGETACAAYAQQHDLPIRIARLGHIYGPGMSLADTRVQAEFARQIARGEDIVLNSDGSAVRTYTYVADAITGMLTILLRGDELAYNVADPAGLISIRELAETFTQVRPERGSALRFGPAVDPSIYQRAKMQGLDSSRLAALGWNPQVALTDGVARMIDSVSSRLATVGTDD
ncbi:NAD-dependent epimerase/dehydratase family protein [Demetria terragena]|uniref:NAD-dependent epimerase/dehydratase family protein n=1 Tax=Demetria terragena TaxID=63959 RepID=UPI000376EA1E|nr:NAD-dependent epimerase/dehydratase family protein [Demetria terragena]